MQSRYSAIVVMGLLLSLWTLAGCTAPVPTVCCTGSCASRAYGYGGY